MDTAVTLANQVFIMLIFFISIIKYNASIPPVRTSMKEGNSISFIATKKIFS